MSSETQLQQEKSHIADELRLRRMWKNDIDAAYRSQASDVLTHVADHVERKLQNALTGHDRNVRDVLQTENKKNVAHLAELNQQAMDALEDLVANIVVKILAEYGVRGRDNQPIQFD